jgi:hypothetical protein
MLNESALITGTDPDSSHPGPPSEASQMLYVAVVGRGSGNLDRSVHSAGYRQLMPTTDAVLATELAPAGLRFIGRIQGQVHPPLPLNRGPASCEPEHGRFDSAAVEIGDPDFAAKSTLTCGAWPPSTGCSTSDRSF